MSLSKQPSSRSIFPIFLLPSIPFRRREPSANSTNLADKDPVTDKYLNGDICHLHCAQCAADLCPTSQIISKGFTGRHGRAYLVSGSPTSRTSSATYLPNTQTGQPVKRQLVTGQHTVSDISCTICGSVIGWKYDAAEEETQSYKVGKFILETKRIFSSSRWENETRDDNVILQVPPATLGSRPQTSVDFDSQDEDECEDLFAGLWSPSLATKRRRAKRFGRVGSRNVNWR